MSPRIHDQPDARAHPEVTVNLHRAAGNWGAARARAKTLVDWDDWRDRAQAARADAVANMPELLDVLEAQVSARGGRVHRAATIEQANARIVAICRDHGARVAVKGKSMTSEETGLAEALGAAGVESVETDLGEWIVQLLGQRPSHILAPAVHLNAGQVAELFSERAGRPFDPDDTQALVRYARGELRERFLSADVGITGANLAVASTGTLAIVESEGNIRLSSGLPRVHIVLMGIEKVVRNWDGAAHLLQMLPLASHGRLSTASTSLITGPARDGDDGPAELHVVLLDDGRSSVRGTSFESALHCIRCGACLYACPVYRQVGGHAYGSTYTGPIGAVITPLLERLDPETDELPWLSSLCGACTEACPVGIPLDEQLVALRAAAVKRGPRDAEARLFDGWGRLWSRPSGYRASAATAGKALRPLLAALARTGSGDDDRQGDGGWIRRAPFPFAGWTAQRDARAPAAEPFHARWARTRGGRARPAMATLDTGAPEPAPAAEATRQDDVRPAVRSSSGPQVSGDQPPPLERFGAALAAVGGELVVAADADAARALARERVGSATVARFADPLLDGIAEREIDDAATAEVSLVAGDVAIADSGTIGWCHRTGRSRATGLLPERQIALVPAGALVPSLADALPRLGLAADAEEPLPGNAVLVAGPSRTADIEQRPIQGVHAPRELTVIICER